MKKCDLSLIFWLFSLVKGKSKPGLGWL